jgi:hypothetical protein
MLVAGTSPTVNGDEGPAPSAPRYDGPAATPAAVGAGRRPGT